MREKETECLPILQRRKRIKRERKTKKVYQSSKAGSRDWPPFAPTCFLTGLVQVQVVRPLLRLLLLSDRIYCSDCRRLVHWQRNSCNVFIEPFHLILAEPEPRPVCLFKGRGHL